LRFEKIKGNFGLFAGLSLFILILVLPPSETFVEYAKLKLSVSEETQDVLKLAYSMKVVFALLLLLRLMLSSMAHGYIKLKDMIKAGLILDIIFAIYITIFFFAFSHILKI